MHSRHAIVIRPIAVDPLLLNWEQLAISKQAVADEAPCRRNSRQQHLRCTTEEIWAHYMAAGHIKLRRSMETPLQKAILVNLWVVCGSVTRDSRWHSSRRDNILPKVCAPT